MSDASSATLLDAAAARTAARNAAVLALASILAKGALFVGQLVLTRLLAQAGYGIYGTIGGMLSIAAAVPDFGMGMIVLRDVAQRRDLAGRALGVTLTIQPLLAALAYLGLIAAGWLLGYDETIRGLLPLAGLSLFVDVLGNMGHNQLLAREQMVIPSIIGVAHIGALIVLVGAALLGGLGMVGLYGATLAAGALLGFYDGFFGPGAGSFMIFAFVGLFGLDFLRASGAAKVVNLATNAAALAYFVPAGQLLWVTALTMAVFNMLGALAGARLAIRHGSGFVRWVFLAVSTVLIGKFGYDTWFRQ
jgi:O-antigen/teichoic acid export membrane protein